MNSEFRSLPPETQEAVKRTMDTMEPAQTPAEIRETLEGTQKGGVKNSIRNCLTVFQRDPLFRGALRLNLLTEQIDIVKPLGWERTSTTLTDMDMNYLLLYLEENYGLTSEKKVQSAIKIVANENRYHPVRDYLNSLQWDGTERIRYALHHFLGADTDEYTYEALKLFLMGAIRRVFRPGSKFEVMLCLVGGQGAGKSTFFRLLAGRDEWFSDDLKKLDDENVYRKLQGHCGEHGPAVCGHRASGQIYRPCGFALTGRCPLYHLTDNGFDFRMIHHGFLYTLCSLISE